MNGGRIFNWLRQAKVVILTSVVVVAFLYTTIIRRHIETDEHQRVAAAAAVLICIYALMIFELVNRNLAALIGAAVSVALYDCFVEFVTMEQILEWQDLETLTLLFGMMILVNVLSCSGVFNFLAIWAYRKADGRFWLLITIMTTITALLSALIDNVSTMLLMSPTIIKLSELEHIDPSYVLMIVVLFSNIGGCATPVGDPPNLIVIGDHYTQELGVTFGSFVAYSAPCVCITVALILLYLRLVYKSKESFRLKNYVKKTSDASEKEPELSRAQLEKALSNDLIIFRALDEQIQKNATRNSEDVCSERLKQINETINKNIMALEQSLDGIRQKQKQANYLSLEFSSDVQNGDQQTRRGSRMTDAEMTILMRTFSIKSKTILFQSIAVLTVTILLFFVQSLPQLNLTLGWISLFAGLTLLILSSSVRVPTSVMNSDSHVAKDGQENNEEGEEEEFSNPDENFEYCINNIEWSTLIFFFSLFIVMEVMVKLGLISFMGKQVTLLIDQIPSGPWRSIGAITIILWSSGIASSCVDNVPFTSMMIKILGTMTVEQQSRTADDQDNLLPIKPLIFALVFGACYGGNGTIIGASANLVTAGISGRKGYPISFGGFCKFATPITIISLLIANVYLVFVFVVMGL